MRAITDAILTSAMTRPGSGPSFMMDRFPMASSRWSAWWPSRSCRDATQRGRSLCCGAAAPSRAPISCSNGSPDKRRLSTSHRSPRAVTSATSSYKSDSEMSLSMSPTTSRLPSCSTHSDQIARSTKTCPIRAEQHPATERGYRITKTATDLGNIGRVGQEQGSAAKITFACASPFALRIWPLAHGNLDDVAQCRRVAEHLVQDSDAFGDADIEAGNGPRVGGRIEKAFGLGAPEHDVDGPFDARGSLGDDTKHLVRRVRELERRIGVDRKSVG